jgi:Ni,Fe-hydrogenase I large subunit
VQVAGGQVTEAYSSSTVRRGVETILVGRDPRDAWLVASWTAHLAAGAAWP